MKIKDFIIIDNNKIETCLLNQNNYISTENMLSNFGGIKPASSIPNGKCTKFDKNMILLSNIRPYFKKMWLSKFCGGCSSDVIAIKVNENICLSNFLYYRLSSEHFFDTYVKGCKGTKMPRGNKDVLLNYDILIPSIAEQQHIVNIIGSIDDLIESNNKLVLKLLSILNNKLEYLITKSTEFIPLKSIISERKERIGLNDVKLLSVVNTGELVLQDEYFDKNTASADMKKYKLIRKFDYAYNPARINIGSIGMLKENYLGAISPIYVVFEIDENYKYYLDFYKSSKYMRKYIEKKSSGSVRQNLPFDEFASIEIPNINTEFLKEFNSLCDLYYKKINDLKTKTIKLQAIKDQYLKKFFG